MRESGSSMYVVSKSRVPQVPGFTFAQTPVRGSVGGPANDFNVVPCACPP